LGSLEPIPEVVWGVALRWPTRAQGNWQDGSATVIGYLRDRIGVDEVITTRIEGIVVPDKKPWSKAIVYLPDEEAAGKLEKHVNRYSLYAGVVANTDRFPTNGEHMWNLAAPMGS
jgi:hypothetical protein